jgi:hypothetical protein
VDNGAGTWSVAGVILLLKAVLGGWAGLVSLRATPLHHQHFFNATLTRRHSGPGVAVLVLTAATLIVAAGLFRRALWARWATFVLEGVAVIVALRYIGKVPGVAVVSMALPAAVVVLVVRGNVRRPLPVDG